MANYWEWCVVCCMIKNTNELIEINSFNFACENKCYEKVTS